MKKIISSILALTIMFCLAACGSAAFAADEASAEETPTESSVSYGIPLWASVDEVDLDVLLNAYNRKSLLQYVKNIEKSEVISDDYSDVYANYSYFLDGDRYVDNMDFSSPTTPSYVPSTTLNIYDTVNKGQSVSCQKDTGLTKTPLAPAAIDTIVETCILPFNPERYTSEAVSRSVLDGHYVITFRMQKAGETGESSEINEGMVVIDPATSLILNYSYHWFYRTPEGTNYSSNTSGKLAYNTEKQPDYSLLS